MFSVGQSNFLKMRLSFIRLCILSQIVFIDEQSWSWQFQEGIPESTRYSSVVSIALFHCGNTKNVSELAIVQSVRFHKTSKFVTLAWCSFDGVILFSFSKFVPSMFGLLWSALPCVSDALRAISFNLFLASALFAITKRVDPFFLVCRFVGISDTRWNRSNTAVANVFKFCQLIIAKLEAIALRIILWYGCND